MGYFVRRIVLTLVSLLLFASLAFALVQFLPGGPIEILEDQEASRGRGASFDRGALQRQYGFDLPISKRYAMWFDRVLSADLGSSIYSSEPVAILLKNAIVPSLWLNGLSLLGLYVLALPLGTALAFLRRPVPREMFSIFITALHSVPAFVTGTGLLLIFSVWTPWFPLQGWRQEAASPFSLVDILWHLFLPCVAMVVSLLSPVVFLVRNAITEEIAKPYVLALHARGIPRGRILFRHVFPNCALSLFSHVGEMLAYFFSGTLLIETTFGISGVGKLAYDSLLRRDFPVLMGLLLVFGCTTILANAIADLLFYWIDPRVRFQ